MGFWSIAVAVAGSLHDELAEVLHLARAVGARERRQRGGDEGEIERRRPPDLGSQLDDTRIASEATPLLGARAEMRTSCRRQPRIELGQAAAGPHGSQRRGQPALGRHGVVGVRRGDAADVAAGRQLGERVVAEPNRAGRRDPTARRGRGRARMPRSAAAAPRRGRWTVVDERSRDGTLAAAGQRPHVPGGVAGDVAERVNCGAPFPPPGARGSACRPGGRTPVDRRRATGGGHRADQGRGCRPPDRWPPGSWCPPPAASPADRW